MCLGSWLNRAAILLFLLAAPAFAQSPAPTPEPALASTQADREQEAKASWQAAMQAGTKGPADVALLDQARLHLPPNMIFVPSEPAARLLRAWGNRVQQSPAGVVVGTRQEDDWAVVVRFVKEGYIKDGDAKDWNADELLKSIREGNDETNEERRGRGFPELAITGWVVKPTYDAATHRLVWSLGQKKKDTPGDAADGINYNTYALGRDGYFSLNLLTNPADVEHDRVAASALLAGLDYDAGKRYADFNESTDHVAEYGLAALVGVVALKKLGIIALGAAFVLKFAKIGVLALAGIGAVVSRVVRGRRKARGEQA